MSRPPETRGEQRRQKCRGQRRVQTVRNGRLDRFAALGEAHLRHLLSEFLARYHEAHPH